MTIKINSSRDTANILKQARPGCWEHLRWSHSSDYLLCQICVNDAYVYLCQHVTDSLHPDGENFVKWKINRSTLPRTQFAKTIVEFEQFFLWKKERFHSAGYRAQDLSIPGRMIYHLSYGGSTKLFLQNLFTPIWPRIYHELYINFSQSFQSIMSIIRRVYHSPW